MLKKFFISLLGSFAGVWIAIFVCVFAGFAFVGALVAAGSAGQRVESHSVLYLDLSKNIPDHTQGTDVISLLQDAESDGDSLIDIIESLRRAASDDRIEGVYINAAGSTAGFATREEILDALRLFKKSGKWIYAYADSYSQADYLLASVADEIFLNPMGSVDVHGICSQVPFFTGLLQKLGVKVQVVRVGTYKSAVEPFTAEGMSPASRLQTQVLVDSLWTFYTGALAENHNIPVKTTNMWADSIWAVRRAADFVGTGVTATKYRREVEDLLREKTDMAEDSHVRLVTPTEYMAEQGYADASKDHVAVLFALGDITDDVQRGGGIAGATMVPAILDLADDDHVRGLVFRVNSGGGSAFASEQIWEAIEYFKSKDKPVYVSMGDYAASGGYYISCGADCIYADHTTLTGSIGVFGLIPDFSGLTEGLLGLKFEQVSSGPNADFGTTMKPLSAQQMAALQTSVENTYRTFTTRVADGRDLPQDSVDAIGQGRVWTGGAALRLGLVDRIGGLNTAISDMVSKLGLDRKDIVLYPETENDLLAQIVLNMQESASAAFPYDRDARKAFIFVEYLRGCARVQARMNPITFE